MHHLDQSHQHIGGHRPLVHLVQNDHPVLLQVLVPCGLGQQHPISAVFQPCLEGDHLFEADGVAHFLAQLHVRDGKICKKQGKL